MPELKILRSPQDIENLIAYLAQFEFVAYDCETTGLARTSQVIGVSVCAEEEQAFYVILSYWDRATQRLVDLGNLEEVKLLLKTLQTKKLIMHNATFDCMMSAAFFNINLIDSLHTDTMILAHLLDENQKIGLKELGKAHFGESAISEAKEMKESVESNGGQVTKTNYEMYKADAQLIAKYGAKDSWLTLKLFYILVDDLYEQGLDTFFYEEESMPLLKGPTFELNTVGLKMDREALAVLKKNLQAECLEAKVFILNEIKDLVKEKYPGTSAKTTFNLGSSSQLAWLLFGKMGLDFGTLTEKGKEICRSMGMKLPYLVSGRREFIERCSISSGYEYEKAAKIVTNGVSKTVRAKKVRDPWNYIQVNQVILKKYADRYTWIKKLLEYQKANKLLSTYVEGFEERIVYGTMNPSFLQHGTPSGRYASRNPNFQNLPRDDKRVKACVVARPGKVFVGADMSQLEPRVFAYYSNDARLKEVFRGAADFYSTIGMEVYNKTDCTPMKDGSPNAFGVKYKKLRDLSKVIALASVYGATAHQLAPTTGKNKEETQKDIDRYFAQFPGVKKFMEHSHDLVRKEGQVKSHFGRLRRLPEAKHIDSFAEHANLDYSARTLLNLAVNFQIQSTGASIVNRSAIMMHKRKNELIIDCKLVLQVHDSLIYECGEADAEQVALLLQDSMENAVQLEGVAFEAKPLIGNNLATV